MTKPRKVDWSAGDWLNGTRTLTNEQRGVYDTIINLIYDIGGPIALKEVCRACIGHSRSTKRIVDALIEAGKVFVNEDGLLDQARCERTLEIARKRLSKFREQQAENGSLGGRPRKETNDLQNPTRARPKCEAKEEVNKNLQEEVGRSAPARSRAPIRDHLAHSQAIEGKKFNAVCKTVNTVAARLNGKAREEAWQVVAEAEKAGSWKAMPTTIRQKLHELYRWAKSLNPQEIAA